MLLGEPEPASGKPSVATLDELARALTGRVPLHRWPDGWRRQSALPEPEASALPAARPAFVRTVTDASKRYGDEMPTLTYQLHRRFGLEMDEWTDARRELMRCSRMLWRPGGPDWKTEAVPPEYARFEDTPTFGRWLADLLGLPDAGEPVIHCEYPSEEVEWEIADQIRRAAENGLVEAVGQGPEPNVRTFRPDKLDKALDELKKVPSVRLGVVALSDMRLNMPATREGAITVFRAYDDKITMKLGRRENLIRVAVLVRAREEFEADAIFDRSSRLQSWSLLPLLEKEDGTFEPDPGSVTMLKGRVKKLRAAHTSP